MQVEDHEEVSQQDHPRRSRPIPIGRHGSAGWISLRARGALRALRPGHRPGNFRCPQSRKYSTPDDTGRSCRRCAAGCPRLSYGSRIARPGRGSTAPAGKGRAAPGRAGPDRPERTGRPRPGSSGAWPAGPPSRNRTRPRNRARTRSGRHGRHLRYRNTVPDVNFSIIRKSFSLGFCSRHA